MAIASRLRQHPTSLTDDDHGTAETSHPCSSPRSTAARPTPVSRASRGRVLGACTAALAVAGTLAVLSPVTNSSASPAPTIKSVEAEISVLNTQAEKITESYDAARGRLTQLKGKAAASRSTLVKDRRVVAGMQGAITKMAAAAYEGGGLSGAVSLLGTGNAETILNRTSDLSAVARVRQAVLARDAAASRVMQQAQTTYRAEVTAERTTVASISTKRSQIQALLAKEQQDLDSLKAAQRRAIAQAAARAHAREVAERNSYHPPAAAPAPAATTQHTTTPTVSGAASGAAEIAVRFAYAQLGKPYVYGAAGPDSYDCSGLTMRAWGAAGVALPHNAAEQQATVPSVSLSDLEPGDLVFFGDPAYHVAIYIGNGDIIQAPHTGTDVQISPLSEMPPTSAGRP